MIQYYFMILWCESGGIEPFWDNNLNYIYIHIYFKDRTEVRITFMKITEQSK